MVWSVTVCDVIRLAGRRPSFCVARGGIEFIVVGAIGCDDNHGIRTCAGHLGIPMTIGYR